ncbi:MAG: PHP domain-containing protein [Ruminococcaceae bacterium]|nr:PHP domain-containing protein [Oscillospiraceae bacterium]
MINEEKIIDLHTHSSFSDGSMTPEELLCHAHEKGISAIALTDHDTVSGIKDASVAALKYGVELVPGVEISSESVSQVHVLGLFINTESQALLDLFKSQQEERLISNKKYISVLAEHGFPITEEEVKRVAPHGGVGRAHYAKIMMDHGWVSSVAEAFDKYLGVGMSCYVKRMVITPEEAIECIHKAGGLAFFAHPYQTKLDYKGIYDLAKHLKNCGLDGIEGYYSEYSPEMHKTFMDMADDLSLLVSGGSDYHALMKPHLEIGVGRGNLKVPYSVLEKIKAALK